MEGRRQAGAAHRLCCAVHYCHAGGAACHTARLSAARSLFRCIRMHAGSVRLQDQQPPCLQTFARFVTPNGLAPVQPGEAGQIVALSCRMLTGEPYPSPTPTSALSMRVRLPCSNIKASSAAQLTRFTCSIALL